jgi:HD-like signal output (HDOD) protein
MPASSQDIRPEQVEDILKGITIPSPPQVLVDLQMDLLMPDPDLQGMARSISKDVGLAGSVLKTVNAPFFGLARQVSSISHAVNLLGINTIVSLVNAYYLRNEMLNKGLSKEDVAVMTRFWDSAMDVANCAALIARQIHFPQQDQAYLLGLFHNAGIPLLKQRFANYPEVQIAAYQQPDGQLTTVENAELHTSHQVMSYYVAKTWRLPQDICSVIRNHHNLERLDSNEDPDVQLLAAILKLAEHIIGLYRVLGDQPVDHEWERIADQVLATLGLDESELEEIISLAGEAGLGQQSYYM